jgi:hypothetical protein
MKNASNKLLTILMMELKHPQVQVVVMSANMGCSLCRQRVANVVSKMNGEHQIKSNQNRGSFGVIFFYQNSFELVRIHVLGYLFD